MEQADGTGEPSGPKKLNIVKSNEIIKIIRYIANPY